MPTTRIFTSSEHAELLELVRDIARKELAPKAAEFEREEQFPRDLFRFLGELGVLGLAYPEEDGGLGLPAEVYLQVTEEIASVWASVAVGVSVHALSCYPIAIFGSEAQRRRLLPAMLDGTTLGAYCLSEPHAGSDPAAMTTTARRDGDEYVIDGTKAWVTHGGVADFYTVMARTSGKPGDHQGISCFVVPADTPGIEADAPERKMGLSASPTASIRFENVRVHVSRRIGEEGEGLKIALSALDSGRLGIAACATGLAQGALDVSLEYAKQRETFEKPIIQHQGVGFMLADMETAIVASRSTMLAAARLKDQCLPYSREASISKLLATDSAMRVTTDAVQVLGGAGYTRDFPVERYMRDAKIMQIFEGTNQIQRMVISRHLERGGSGQIHTLEHRTQAAEAQITPRRAA
ncbi:acyl-CoA dehydrogenase family protein [Leucobacter denitrificans]|uniref:Acyl-CoA dehydrogenase family protein n=1 Tax=Leucobacter denitrificans TaxID=683042 RepID=A0A7G9S4V2_9MICO|nr:acyl-CoA dehydrogenase family protein [Leucobacter denitrificans]QNN62877.1 acyl-CoA dehydrogenase family protein [Leucobacter denitrificans]